MKLLSLIRAVLTEDMNIFKYTVKEDSSKLKKVLFPVVLFFVLALSIGVYLVLLADQLHEFNMTFIILTITSALIVLLCFTQGLFKSQGILFDSKDNDMLLSMPIRKSTILFVRLFKLLLFETLYSLLIFLPAIVVYGIYEKPGISFYLLSLLMIILLPIIPVIISSFLGYIVKLAASKFKYQKIVQTLFTTALVVGIMMVSLNTNKLIEKLAQNATSINDLLTKVYYPIGTYIELIQKFDITKFILLLLFNIIPLLLFIWFGKMFYFTILSKSKNSVSRKVKAIDSNYKIKANKPIISLTKKEVKRLLSSPVYMFNTTFGLFLMLVFSLILVFKGKEAMISLLSNYNISSNISLDLLFYFIIISSLAMTSISSSSISLEGKTINFTKTFPIDYKIILQSKILTCLVIEIPFVIVSILLYITKFGFDPLFISLIVVLSLSLIILNSVIGLIMNLKYPKLNALNDTEVVKQSASSTISVFIGIGIMFASIVLFIIFGNKIESNILYTIHVSVIVLLTIILYSVLMKTGPDKYKKLN